MILLAYLAVTTTHTVPNWAGILTAASTLLLAVAAVLGGVLSIVKVFLPIKRNGEETKKTVLEVHQLVNQQHTDLANYANLLAAYLQANGIEIPKDPSLNQLPTQGTMKDDVH